MTRRKMRLRTCMHTDMESYHGRCVKTARVRCVIEMAGRQLVTYRCWSHYLVLEEMGRNSSTLTVVKAREIE